MHEEDDFISSIQRAYREQKEEQQERRRQQEIAEQSMREYLAKLERRWKRREVDLTPPLSPETLEAFKEQESRKRRAQRETRAYVATHKPFRGAPRFFNYCRHWHWVDTAPQPCPVCRWLRPKPRQTRP